MTPRRKKIILSLLGIAYISLPVMIWGLFINISIWGVLAAAVCIISLAIALMLGVPIDSKGFPSDDGL